MVYLILSSIIAWLIYSYISIAVAHKKDYAELTKIIEKLENKLSEK